MAGFLTSSSVSLDNGSNVVNVTGSVDCSFVVSGTAVYINDMLMEGVSGTAADPSGNSNITLRNVYTGTSIVGGALVAFNTIEGLRDAIQRARELSAQFQSGLVDISQTDTSLKTFLTVLDPTTTITFNDESTVVVTPYQVLVNKVTAQGEAENVQWQVGKSVGYSLDDLQGFSKELYAQSGITDSGIPDTLGNSQRVMAINELINRGGSFTIAEAKAKTNFYEGQIITIKDYGLSYKYKSSRFILDGQSQSEMTYEDNMHILVDTGGMLVFCDWGAIPSIQSKNFSKYSAKLKDRTNEISIANFGDSITFAQALPDTVGATNKIGQPTNFGDGSTYGHWQFDNSYPVRIYEYFQDNFSQMTNVNNLGYSGDRLLTGYLRHRESLTFDLITIMYGVNDCLFATSNGSQPQGISTGLYSVANYEKMLRFFAAKQILNGASVVILGTAPFASLAGYDGSQLAANRLVRSYNASAKKVAGEFGCRYVDVCVDIFTQYGIPEITQEGTHLNEGGLKILGNRVSASLVTVESDNEVVPNSILIANPNINCILSKTGGNILANTTSTTPRGTVSNDRTCLTVSENWVSIPFYSSTDSLVAYINGSAGLAGCTFDIRLDNGALQSDYHYQRDYYSGKPTASKQLTKNNKFNRDNINISDDANGAFLHVVNKGWHTISIRKVSGVGSLLIDSLTFESLNSVINSDMKGVTASCTVSAGVLSDSINVESIDEAFPSEWIFTFSNALFNNKFTVIADSNETSANPVTYTIRYKTSTSFGVVFNRFNGTSWEIFTPTTFTVKVVGGR